jgi:sugar phosphate isomerase/epimerase
MIHGKEALIMNKCLTFLVPAVLLLGVAAGSPASGAKTIRLGVCDWTIEKSGDPSALETAGKWGLEGVQVSLTVKDGALALLQPSLQKTYKAEVRRTGVSIASFCLGDLNGVPLKSDPRAAAWLEQSLAVCRAMDVRLVLVPFFGKGELRDDDAGVETVLRILKRLAPKAKKAGVVLALENYLSAEDNLKIIARVGSPAVAVYYDVANSQQAGYDIVKEIRTLGARIAQFHAKDLKGLYGQGSIDFPAVRRAMDDIGYSGWFVFEGPETPLGLEQSIRADVEFLRTLYPLK